MLTLYHAPLSRSSVIAQAIIEMEVADRVHVRPTQVPRADGSGAVDPANPHPEGKVPLLDHGGTHVWERPAILIYLSDLFPDAPGIRPAGHAQRGPFLSWLAYYGDVVEPVFILKAAELSHPYITAGLRGFDEVAGRLSRTFADGRDFLLPDGFSVADLLVASPFMWFRDYLPEDPATRAWFERVDSRASVEAVRQSDQAAMTAAA